MRARFLAALALGALPLAALASGDDDALLAQTTHDFVVGNLLTRDASYLTSTTSPDTTDEWHDASQIYADAAMVRLGDDRYRAYMDATFSTFMYELWDWSDANGGYFPRCAPDGTRARALSSGKWGDDNALTGVVYLEAFDVADPSRKLAYLASAEACAGWLMRSGLWDDTEGGGFWWTTSADADARYKPTNANGLALQLFSRLSIITGDPTYLGWARATKGWLDANRFDAASGLYYWRGGSPDVIFTYDNAIMIEAVLAYGDATGDPCGGVAAAESLATNMQRVLWDAADGGFPIHTQDLRKSPVFSAWATQSLLALAARDGDPRWRALARANVDFLDAHLRDPSSGGYFASCTPGGVRVDSTEQEVDQAWMQRVHALLAASSR